MIETLKLLYTDKEIYNGGYRVAMNSLRSFMINKGSVKKHIAMLENNLYSKIHEKGGLKGEFIIDKRVYNYWDLTRISGISARFSIIDILCVDIIEFDEEVGFNIVFDLNYCNINLEMKLRELIKEEVLDIIVRPNISTFDLYPKGFDVDSLDEEEMKKYNNCKYYGECIDFIYDIYKENKLQIGCDQ